MKIFLILALAPFVCKLAANAQNAIPTQASWVLFKDKGCMGEYAPTSILSQRALDRRERQGIAIDYNDYPVWGPYVAELRNHAAQVRGASRWFNAAIADLSPQQIASVEALPFVAGVRPIRLMKIQYATLPQPESAEPSSASIPATYGPENFPQYDMLNLKPLHNRGFKGDGVVIAVCDDGFNRVDELNAFAYMRSRNAILGWYDYVDRDCTVFRQGGHGTAVLSTICGMFFDKDNPQYEGSYLHGTAPNAKFWLFRTEDAGSETPVEESNYVLAAERADSLGVDIIHASLGYSNFDEPHPDHTYRDMDGRTTTITRAADLAASRGILVVNSAGNSGDEAWYYITAPADGDSVLTIGAVDASGQIARFSSRGPTADGRIKPEVCGMGLGPIVAEPDGSVGPSNGTSFSGPIITGFAASVYSSAMGTPGGMELYRAVVVSANLFRGPDNVFGHGVPNAQIAHGYLKMLKAKPDLQNPSEPQAFIHPDADPDFVVLPEAFFGQWLRLEHVTTDGILTNEWFLCRKIHPSFQHYPVSLSNGATGGPQTAKVNIFDRQGLAIFSWPSR